MIPRFLLLFCFIFSNAVSAQNNKFSLSGKTVNIEDGTYLYFRDMIHGGSLDSAIVKNNSFRFNTKLPESAIFVILHTKDRKIFKELWLEDNPMLFDASNGDFNEAKVIGSKNQILFKELNEEVWADYLEVDGATLKQREREFIKSNPSAIVSAFMLFANSLWNQKEIAELFYSLSDEVQNSSMGQKKIVPYLEKNLPDTGDNFLDFSIPDSEGKNQKISDLSGKLTLLQFWSSGCGFSRSMNSTLSSVYKKYNSQGFEIISISKDADREEWLRAITEDQLSWPQLSNLQSWNGQAFKGYGVNSTPSNFLINEEGIIIDRNLKEDKLEEAVKIYLKN